MLHTWLQKNFRIFHYFFHWLQTAFIIKLLESQRCEEKENYERKGAISIVSPFPIHGMRCLDIFLRILIMNSNRAPVKCFMQTLSTLSCECLNLFRLDYTFSVIFISKHVKIIRKCYLSFVLNHTPSTINYTCLNPFLQDLTVFGISKYVRIILK